MTVEGSEHPETAGSRRVVASGDETVASATRRGVIRCTRRPETLDVTTGIEVGS